MSKPSSATSVRDDAPAATAKDTKPARSLVAASVTINRQREEVYSRFRQFSRLPEFMENIVQVVELDERRSRWQVLAPGDRTVEWVSTITEDKAGEAITWRSEADADVINSGQIRFADAGERGTIVTATIAYEPPAGIVGKLVAKLFQREPAIQTRRDLVRFKQLMETGEIATAARNLGSADRPADQDRG